MIDAALMVGERLVAMRRLDSPRPFLFYHISTMLSLSNSSTAFSSDDTTTYNGYPYEFESQHIRFKRARKIGIDAYEYQFDYVQPRPMQFTFTESIQLGEREPDENVNLHRLAKKCRRRRKVIKLLKAYFRR